MEIEFKRRYGMELIFTAENVKIEDDIEERIYPKLENGKSDFSKVPQRDIKDEAIQQFVNVLGDLMYYREREFDSSDTIFRMFEKLPHTKQQDVLKKLINDYEIEEK